MGGEVLFKIGKIGSYRDQTQLSHFTENELKV